MRFKFTCQGREIPDNSFNTLLRLEGVKKLEKYLPDEHLRNFGIRDRKTLNSNELSDDELSSIIDEYKGELHIANKLDIAWVTDDKKTEQISVKVLIDRLGLVNLENEERCLKITYERRRTEKNLHLPRSFDGIDQPRFEVTVDCEANFGKTVPLNSSREQGLPEAVHRGCKVKPNIFEVESIE